MGSKLTHTPLIPKWFFQFYDFSKRLSQRNKVGTKHLFFVINLY